MLLCLSAKFFCAQACWAVRIELEVGIQVRKQRGIIVLTQMDDRQQPINDGLGWREFRGLLRSRANTIEGGTSEVNRNVLAVINRELNADFDVDAFHHVAS